MEGEAPPVLGDRRVRDDDVGVQVRVIAARRAVPAPDQPRGFSLGRAAVPRRPR